MALIAYSQVVDLSHVLHPNIPRWPGDPPLELEPVARLEEHGYYLRRVSLGEHSGTHLTAPSCFYSHGATVDRYRADSLVAPAVVMEIRGQAARNADYALSLADVVAWEQQHQAVPAGSLVLLHTGWQARWDDPEGFFGRDAGGALHFPGFGQDAARYLLEARAIAGLGADAPGVDPGWDTTFAVSRLILQQPRLVLENLTNLERLPPTGATLVIGVLRLQGGSGSPASVLAFVP